MMERLMSRSERLAREAQRRQVERVARHLKSLIGTGAVEVEEARVLVRGRGLVKRWLIDPSLRFLNGGLK